jgi:hypothetical protein
MLFKLEDFISHAGLPLFWKVECDALTDDDWKCLAKMATTILPPFGLVVGIPRGGLKFADALSKYVTVGPDLIADDVLTTGSSFFPYLEKNPTLIGIVVFARGPIVIPNVKAIWNLGT